MSTVAQCRQQSPRVLACARNVPTAPSRKRARFAVLRLALAAVVAAVVVSLVPAVPASAVGVEVLLEQQLFDQMNAERAARGLPAMERNNGLDQASLAWSNTMASEGSLYHSSDGRAEIIARGWWTGQITDAWMRSDGHRNLMVDPNLGSAGVGVTCDASGQVWATIQFHRIDKTQGTLDASPVSPRVVDSSAGSDCGEKTSINQVRRLYLAYFRRESDRGGLGYWVSQISDGVGLGEVSHAFASSPEFIGRYGNLNDRSFVRLVYVNVLGREPDEAGYQYWVAELRGGLSRGELMIGFSESGEFRTASGIA